MQTSKAIYRLAKLARLLDVEGGAEDVQALNMAVEAMSGKLKDEQISAAVAHVIRPNMNRKGKPILGFRSIAGKKPIYD